MEDILMIAFHQMPRNLGSCVNGIFIRHPYIVRHLTIAAKYYTKTDGIHLAYTKEQIKEFRSDCFFLIERLYKKQLEDQGLIFNEAYQWKVWYLYPDKEPLVFITTGLV